jgi:hypothetical protein
MIATQSPTGLDDDTLTRLRAEAEAHGGPFIDPALLREASTLLPWVGRDWLEHIIGRHVTTRPTWQNLGNAGLYLAVQAAKADAAHLEALATARRAERERAAREAAEAIAANEQAERGEWAALAVKLPVPVEVWHNWTARHLDGYEQGADHIVVLEDLHAGQLHRSAKQPLCWTPSRARELRHVSGNVGDERRLPDCKACLRRAEKLTAQEV